MLSDIKDDNKKEIQDIQDGGKKMNEMQMFQQIVDELKKINKNLESLNQILFNFEAR